MRRVIVTGISGFIGSKIAEKLLREGVCVIGLKRLSSDLWRCKDFINDIEWIDIADGYQEKLVEQQPDVIIHSAWIGVEADDRDNWSLQAQNIQFLIELLEVADRAKVKKIIFLGSQAEYGIINNKISEDSDALAKTAYGSIKLACLEIIKTFSELKEIKWIWLRIFSLFGENENENWLIPSMVKKMKTESEMDFTEGEQKYAYLYIKDFTEIIVKVLTLDIKSGVYNVSSNEAKSLKSIIIFIRDFINPAFRLNFGVIPYRKNQSMHIQGDTTKLCSAIGEINFTNFNVALQLTLSSYLDSSETI